MPNVVGKNLDAATGKLDSEGIQYALNSNGKHVILKFDGAFVRRHRKPVSPRPEWLF
jgi:hypothetical protein